MDEKILITSKWNGRNYLAYTKNGIKECLKVNGRFYIAKLFDDFKLYNVWEPLKNFTLIE